MNKTILSLGVVALALGAIVIVPSISNAYRGDVSVKGPNYTAERHESMEKAFDSLDFTSWQTLMAGRGRVTQVVNKDNFAKFSQMHELMEDGKLVEAQKLRAELGLGLQNGQGKGTGNGTGNHFGNGRGMGMGRNR